MSWTKISSCPKCGAPIYVPLIWFGTLPPPPQYSCGCNPQMSTTTKLNTTCEFSKNEELSEPKQGWK